jgi:CCR4-NOT transcription complex subunit 6
MNNITNAHLYSNEDFPDVKIWQPWLLPQELETFAMSRGGSPNSLPLVTCGDFNSTPDTAVYKLLSRQTVHPGHPDVNVKYTQQQANEEDIPNMLPDAHNITHSFQLGSAYQMVLGEEPKQTNYTGHF